MMNKELVNCTWVRKKSARSCHVYYMANNKEHINGSLFSAHELNNEKVVVIHLVHVSRS